MPTPSNETAQVWPASLVADAHINSSCPPDYDADRPSLPEEEELVDESSSSPPSRAIAGNEKLSDDAKHEAHTDIDMLVGEYSPFEEEESRAAKTSPPASQPNTSTSLAVISPDFNGYMLASTPSGMQEFSSLRVIPNYPSSLLRYGSKFVGIQKSEHQSYNVEVEIKHIDMAESSLCGYLSIDGLTPDHPTITTFFEGEIIGPRHGFLTKHAEWGATEKTDIQHWERFSAFRPHAKQARKPDFRLSNTTQRENIFMRWKEKFLVPDYKVAEINGASFEGFYYICFNQITGDIEGFYFFAKSEKYQQLKLKHVPNKYCLGGMEFR